MKVKCWGGGIAITNFGINEVEAALTKPKQGTQHFPPNVTLHVQTMNVGNVGSVEGSQQNIIGSSDVVAMQNTQQGMTVKDFAQLAQEIRSFQQNLNLDLEDIDILEAELKTIEAQVKSPKPKLEWLKESANTVKDVLVRAAPGVVTASVKAMLGIG